MEAAEVYLGGSTVLAAVLIVVKYRACLLVGRLIIGRLAWSFIIELIYRCIGTTVVRFR